jgi:hypothetical protein
VWPHQSRLIIHDGWARWSAPRPLGCLYRHRSMTLWTEVAAGGSCCACIYVATQRPNPGRPAHVPNAYHTKCLQHVTGHTRPHPSMPRQLAQPSCCVAQHRPSCSQPCPCPQPVGWLARRGHWPTTGHWWLDHCGWGQEDVYAPGRPRATSVHSGCWLLGGGAAMTGLWGSTTGGAGAVPLQTPATHTHRHITTPQVAPLVPVVQGANKDVQPAGCRQTELGQ